MGKLKPCFKTPKVLCVCKTENDCNEKAEKAIEK